MKFSEWMPDRDEFDNPGITECLNVIPDTFYKPIGALVGQGSAMIAYGRGGFGMEDSTNVAFNFAGDETDLYHYQAAGWVSTNTSYGTSFENVWQFTEFGTFCVATNFDDVIQVFDVDNDSAFSALGGSPPKAKHITVVGDFLVLANIEGQSNRVKWSGLNDITEWTDGVKESDFQDLPEGGTIRAIVGGEYGLIFQDNRITRMNYQGPPFAFSFDVIETNRGAISSGSVIKFGIYTYYLSDNGFFKTDGTQSVSISVEKIDTYFFAKYNEAYPHKITATVNPIDKTIMWSYVGKDVTDGLPNWLIIYNWELNRWSEANISHDLIFNGLTNSTDLDSLDALYPDLDAMELSLDSRFFKGGTLNTFAIDPSHQLSTFSGAALDGKITTAEYELMPGQTSVLTQVWPLIDGTITVKVYTRDNYQDTAVPTGDLAVNSLGFAPFQARGRYHKMEFNFSNWTKAAGFNFRSEGSGGF